jgi:hypothetical protein
MIGKCSLRSRPQNQLPSVDCRELGADLAVRASECSTSRSSGRSIGVPRPLTRTGQSPRSRCQGLHLWAEASCPHDDGGTAAGSRHRLDDVRSRCRRTSRLHGQPTLGTRNSDAGDRAATQPDAFWPGRGPSFASRCGTRAWGEKFRDGRDQRYPAHDRRSRLRGPTRHHAAGQGAETETFSRGWGERVPMGLVGADVADNACDGFGSDLDPATE